MDWGLVFQLQQVGRCIMEGGRGIDRCQILLSCPTSKILADVVIFNPFHDPRVEQSDSSR